MSRSFRKHPICGITTCKSEKKDKRLANRQFRRITKEHVNKDYNILPIMNSISNPWGFGKDGKQHLYYPLKYIQQNGYLIEVINRILRK